MTLPTTITGKIIHKTLHHLNKRVIGPTMYTFFNAALAAYEQARQKYIFPGVDNMVGTKYGTIHMCKTKYTDKSIAQQNMKAM